MMSRTCINCVYRKSRKIQPPEQCNYPYLQDFCVNKNIAGDLRNLRINITQAETCEEYDDGKD